MLEGLKGFIDLFADPQLFFATTVVALVLIVWKREAFSSTRDRKSVV